MRTSLTAIILLISVNFLNAQLIEPTPNSSPQEFYDYYMIKSKKNNTAAWICLGGGIGLFSAGLALGTVGTVDLFTDGDTSRMGAGAGLMIMGASGVAISIPLFISSASNKKKARLSIESVQNKVGIIQLDNSNTFVISLKIPID